MGSRSVPRTPNHFAPWKKLVHLLLILAVASVAAIGAAAPSRAQMDWQQQSGSTINLLLISHPFVDALKPLLPEFTELTGIEVTYEELAEQPGFEKLLADLSSGTRAHTICS